MAESRVSQSDVTISSFVTTPTLVATILFLALLQLAILLCPAPTLNSYCSLIANRVFSYQRSSTRPPPTEDSVANGVRWCLLLPLVVPHLIEVFVNCRPLLRRFNVESRVVRWQYYVLTAVSGFPVWRTLRVEGERREHALKVEKEKGGHAH